MAQQTPQPGTSTEATAAAVPASPTSSRTTAELFAMVYEDIRKLAAARIQALAPGQTLQATALAHEALIRMSNKSMPAWENASHLIGLATQAMRDIIVENARRKASIKHGGGRRRVELNEQIFADGATCDDSMHIDIDDALLRLEEHDPELAQIASMRIFAQLTNTQVAEAMNLSPRTAERRWMFAKAWLHRELTRRASET